MSLSCLLRRALLFHKPQPISHTSLINPAIVRSRTVPLVLSLKRFNFSTSPAEVTATEEEQKPSEVVDHSKVKGRTVENIPVETSIRYLQSKAYSITYGADPVWKNYRRNFKGGIPPKKTRKTCIRSGKISTGNPCPICRDDYLVFSPDNVNLLKQFISPHSGETLSYKVTGVCQKRHRQLLGAIDIAKDRGSLTFDVPFRSYNYSDYKK